MSYSLWPHRLQHARLPCPSLSPWVCSNSYPLSRWCYPTSVVPFSSCPQSFSASGSFPVSQLFASGGQSVGASASSSVLPVNIQGWFPLELTGWVSCCPKDTQESSPAPQLKSISSLALSLLYGPTLTSMMWPYKRPSQSCRECVGVSKRGVGWQQRAVGAGAPAAAVLGGAVPRHKPSWRRSPLVLP